MENAGTQVKDMDIRTSPDVNKHMPVRNAWNLMRENGIVTLPIKDENGTLEGLITDRGHCTESYVCGQLYSRKSKDTVFADCTDFGCKGRCWG